MNTPNRLIAIGDIHGCYDELKILIEDEINIQKSDRIVFLGDYIDRGSDSKEVVNYIIDLIDKGFDIITLIGNHEKMLIDAYEEECKNSIWLLNGGKETLDSFGINVVSELPDKYRKFFNELEYYYCYNDFIFVHAGFNDRIINPFEDVNEMIWSRTKYYRNPILVNRTIIHGHTPITLDLCKNIIGKKSKVLNLDTGCVYQDKASYGYLTALDIFSNTIYSI